MVVVARSGGGFTHESTVTKGVTKLSTDCALFVRNQAGVHFESSVLVLSFSLQKTEKISTWKSEIFNVDSRAGVSQRSGVNPSSKLVFPFFDSSDFVLRNFLWRFESS